MHYIITLFNLIYPTLLQLQITIKLKTFRISFFTHKKKYIFKAQRAKFQVFFSRDKESVFDGEKKKRAQSGTGNRVARVSFANCGWVHAFVSPPETSPMTQTRKRPFSRRRKRKREKKRERKGNRRTRDERFFLRFSSADLPPPPPGWMDTAQESLLCPKVKYLPFPARDSHILARVSYLTHGRLLFLSLSLGEEDSRSLAS